MRGKRLLGSAQNSSNVMSIRTHKVFYKIMLTQFLHPANNNNLFTHNTKMGKKTVRFK